MIWVERRRGEAIPENLYYKGWEMDRDNHNRTPIMIWAVNRYDEAIPKKLYYHNW